jgi:hypothetical protein
MGGRLGMKWEEIGGVGMRVGGRTGVAFVGG